MFLAMSWQPRSLKRAHYNHGSLSVMQSEAGEAPVRGSSPSLLKALLLRSDVLNLLLDQMVAVADSLSFAGAAEYKRMLKHLKEPKASLSVIPEGIKGEHCEILFSSSMHTMILQAVL